MLPEYKAAVKPENLRLSQNRLEWSGYEMVGERFGMEVVEALNGCKVCHHSPEHLIAGLICLCRAIRHLMAVFLDSQFLRHQPEQQIDVVTLSEEELGFL